ncbi:hypothetical protein CTI14_64110, partial [Methylobacterium radiotolerans]
MVAIVGRPNVGKSALVNRILAVVRPSWRTPPVSPRDRVTYKAEWNDRRFTVVFLPALPVVAIVGRPNVGKSALVNRILAVVRPS